MQWKILAGLRFFLAWIVLSSHLRFFVPAGDPLLKFGKLGGLSAVLGFLLVSGYSIANSITKNPDGFYQRRVLRIYPLYVTAVILSLPSFWLLGSKIQVLKTEYIQPDLWTIAGNLTFLQGFTFNTVGSNRALWTLSIELLCYLLAPIFIKLGSKILLILIGISSCLYAMYPYLNLAYYGRLSYGLPFLMLFWSWLLGFLYFLNKEKLSAKMILVVLGCILLELNQVHNNRFSLTTYLLSSLILIYSPYLKLPVTLGNLLSYLGNISYPLYLFHTPTLIFGYSVLGIKSSFELTFLCLLTSIIFYHAIDVPVNSLIKLRKTKPAQA